MWWNSKRNRYLWSQNWAAENKCFTQHYWWKHFNKVIFGYFTLQIKPNIPIQCTDTAYQCIYKYAWISCIWIDCTTEEDDETNFMSNQTQILIKALNALFLFILIYSLIKYNRRKTIINPSYKLFMISIKSCKSLYKYYPFKKGMSKARAITVQYIRRKWFHSLPMSNAMVSQQIEHK